MTDTGRVIDFHTHVFPDPLDQLAHFRVLGALGHLISIEKVVHLRKQARGWIRPIAGSLHSVQTILRHLPVFTRKNLDEVLSVVPIAGLLLESTPSDLAESMSSAQIDYALVVAHPPTASNDFVLEVCAANPKLLPVVNISKGTPKGSLVLKNLVKRGAKALKIHAAADGEGADSPRYKKLLQTASELNIPVIIHTGWIQSHLLYKRPSSGSAEKFSSWFENYPELRFILAHMNFHDPGTALDLCEEHGNVYVDTSWQPAEIVGEAVRRIGAERVLFASDWPLIGNNMNVGRKRIEECIEIGLLNEEQSRLILGANAAKLLGMNKDAN